MNFNKEYQSTSSSLMEDDDSMNSLLQIKA